LIAFLYGGDVTVSATLFGAMCFESFLLSAHIMSLTVNFFFNAFCVTCKAIKLFSC